MKESMNWKTEQLKLFNQENSIETCILSRVKQITSPGWVRETSAWAWCTGRPRGIRWRGRWEAGSGWGIHVYPWLIHVNV